MRSAPDCFSWILTLTIPKKHKTSGLSGLELQLAYQPLKSLQDTIALEERESSADDGEEPDFAKVVAD